jgi:aryl-alcohol dehydrogenase-like predicted oxidoreductase
MSCGYGPRDDRRGGTMTNSGPTFSVGGDISVRRLGFGAMRITGPGTWGPPPDRAAARALLHRAVELGVQLIDTADAYGPGVSEELIAEALFPYDDLLIATKGGYERTGPSGRNANGELTGWTPNGRPGHLRSACEASLSRLRLDRIDLYQLHTPDPAVPYAESIGALNDLRCEGKIRHIGISNITLQQLAIARTVTAISTVQNHLDLTRPYWQDMLTECESHKIGFIPYRPLRAWADAKQQHALAPAACRHNANTNQIALAWLLAISPVTLPIPGTATQTHLEANVAAAALQLDQNEIDAISAAVSRPRGQADAGT